MLPVVRDGRLERFFEKTPQQKQKNTTSLLKNAPDSIGVGGEPCGRPGAKPPAPTGGLGEGAADSGGLVLR